MDIGSSANERLIKTAIAIAATASIDNAIFQHSVLCQTFLPYRDPGKEVTLWERKQGKTSLAIQVLQVKSSTGEYEYPGLPFGPKGRLILAYLNSQAIKTQSPIIDVEETITGFLKALGLSKDGRALSALKEQLRRINSSVISLAYESLRADLKIVKAFDVGFGKDEQQRVLWNSTICLSQDYFENLVEHAVPLDERALISLSHNAMAMDIYAWLAQRLHRIKNSQEISWSSIQEQFGSEHKFIRKFRQNFREALRQAKTQYLGAKIEDTATGLVLYNSPTPIPGKQSLAILKP